MIASVRGPVLEIALDHAVIDCGGVGYRVLATPATLSRLRRGELDLVLIERDEHSLPAAPRGMTDVAQDPAHR